MALLGLQNGGRGVKQFIKNMWGHHRFWWDECYGYSTPLLTDRPIHVITRYLKSMRLMWKLEIHKMRFS